MKNKMMALALSLSFVFTGVNQAYAANEKIINPNEKMQNENELVDRNYIYTVTSIKDNEVKLMYNGEKTKDSIIIEEVINNTNLTLDKNLFDEDIAINDQYLIKSPNRIGEINSKDIKKEDVSLLEKYQKPTNQEKDKLPEDSTNMDFVVEDAGKNGEKSGVLISEVGNPDNKYTISYDQLRDKDIKKGDKYKIYWNGVVLESYPAQFGEIYRVEKLGQSEDDDKQTTKLEFEVVEKHQEGVTLAEVGNKDNIYSISFEDLKDKNPKIGDRYMITWSGNSTRSYPAQFIAIVNVEKWMKKDNNQSEVNKDDLKKAIDEADKTSVVNASFSKESIAAFKDSTTKAKEVYGNENSSQEEVDKAEKNLKEAISDITFVIDKNIETTKVYEIVEITGEGEDKYAILAEKDNKDSRYQVPLKELKDADAKVGDTYEIKTDGIILPSEPAQFGKVLDVAKIEYNKTVDKSELNKTIMDADKILFGDASYKEETVDNFHKANNQAKKVYENKEASQKEVDEANKNLKNAIENLAEKDGVIKKKFVLKEIIKKGGKEAVLQSVDYPDKEFTVSLDALNEKNPKVNDYYMVTIEKVDPKAEPFEMREITKIEKIMEEEKKVEAPKADKKVGFGNPKTGITSVAPLVGVIAGAAALLKKKFD